MYEPSHPGSWGTKGEPRVKRSTLRSAVAALALFGLVAAACGDDDDSSEPTATTTEPSGAETTTTTGDGSEGEDDPLAAIGIDLDDCGGSYDPVEGVSDTEIKIGQSVPKSGPASTFALLTQGMRGYFEYANAELDGVNGRKITLIDLDDGYEPARTSQNVDELLNQGIFATSGILGTPQNLAVRDTLNDECVPHLFPSTGAPDWGDAEEYPWTVGGAVIPYNVEARIWAEYLQEQYPDGATVVALAMDNEFGQAYEDWLGHYLEGTNIELAQVEKHDPAAADIRNQMTTLASTDADVAIAMTTSTYCSQFMKSFEGGAWQPRQIISGTCKTGILFAGGAGGALNAEIVAISKEITDSSYDADPEAVKVRDGLAKYAPGAPASVSLVPIGWLYGEVLRDVLLRADEMEGGLSRPNVIAAARATDFTSPLLYEGVQLKMDGLEDTFLVESGRIEKWNGTTFEKVTDLYDYEGETRPTPE
jgi:branched-chain amino acid transport system substrate-binding protein